MNITSQSIARAIVPFFIRTGWPTHELYHADVLRADDSEMAKIKHGWHPVWALYKYNDAQGRVHTVEAQALISRHWHDFCGGLLVSSASVNTYHSTDSTWDGRRSMYCAWGKWHLSTFSHLPESVPSLHDFLKAKSLTHEQATAIMRRSLCAALVSRGVSMGKLGLLAMDRVDYAPRTRTILREAANLTWVYGSPIAVTANIDLVDCWENAEERPTLFTNGTSDAGLVGVHVEVNDTWSYINRNSGQRVGPIMLSIELTNEYGNPYPEDEEDEDDTPTQTYQSLPVSVHNAQLRKDYMRLFPSRIFTNG